MAESPSHRFGQVVGNLLEELLEPELLRFCRQRGLYLDKHGIRTNVRKGRKVSWGDKYGNSHDLDFVIEKDGSENRKGRPVAFIEAAWRRYTKHSKAKAQEIQGAILPIYEKYELDSPFLGVVLAGVFTQPSLQQLESLKFNIVYISYESIINSFLSVGIDANFNERTPDINFRRCVDLIELLSSEERNKVKRNIFIENEVQFQNFFIKLERKLDRITERVTILPLFGTAYSFSSAAEAAKFIENFDSRLGENIFQKYEVFVRFSNYDEIRGSFSNKEEAIHFLKYVTS